MADLMMIIFPHHDRHLTKTKQNRMKSQYEKNGKWHIELIDSKSNTELVANTGDQ